MEQVAQDAHISRPGLYFMFASKQTLFREAVELSLTADLAAVERTLAGCDTPFEQRLLDAFDHWAGRYVGPLTRDVAAVVEGNPHLLGPVVEAAPQRFSQLITEAIAEQQDGGSDERAALTLISTSIGIKHQVEDRQAYLERLEIAIDLILTRDSGATP